MDTARNFRPMGGARWGTPRVATAAPVADETEGMDRRIAESKCSVLGCGAQATHSVELASLGFDPDHGNMIIELSFRCDDHVEDTGPGPLS
jgi:hypothetical protein